MWGLCQRGILGWLQYIPIDVGATRSLFDSSKLASSLSSPSKDLTVVVAVVVITDVPCVAVVTVDPFTSDIRSVLTVILSVSATSMFPPLSPTMFTKNSDLENLPISVEPNAWWKPGNGCLLTLFFFGSNLSADRRDSCSLSRDILDSWWFKIFSNYWII